MPPGAEKDRAHDCMFPWTILEQSATETDAACPAASNGRDDGDDEERAEETPLPYRAWCVAHADELSRS